MRILICEDDEAQLNWLFGFIVCRDDEIVVAVG